MTSGMLVLNLKTTISKLDSPKKIYRMDCFTSPIDTFFKTKKGNSRNPIHNVGTFRNTNNKKTFSERVALKDVKPIPKAIIVATGRFSTAQVQARVIAANLKFMEFAIQIGTRLGKIALILKPRRTNTDALANPK